MQRRDTLFDGRGAIDDHGADGRIDTDHHLVGVAGRRWAIEQHYRPRFGDTSTFFTGQPNTRYDVRLIQMPRASAAVR